MRTIWTVAVMTSAALLSGGCSSDQGNDHAVGGLTMTLAASGPSGAVYRLRDAVFLFRGPQNEDVSSEDYPLDDPVIDLTLPSGSYQVTLQDGWRMEYRLNGQPFADIPADLVTTNPLAVTVITDQVTPLIFRFEVDGTLIEFGPGTVALDVEVEEVDPRRWGTAEDLETTNDFASGAHGVAIDPQGNAVAVWTLGVGGANQVISNRFTPSGGWEGTQRISNIGANGGKSSVAMDAQGNAVAVWVEGDRVQDHLWSARFTPSGGWSNPERIEYEDTNQPTTFRLAIDPQGNAVAVWIQVEGAQDDLWSNRFTPSGGWGTPERIESLDFDAAYPELAMDALGNAVAVWVQRVGGGTQAGLIWSNRFTPSAGWGNAVRIDNADLPDLPIRNIHGFAMDAQGNALTVWSAWDGGGSHINYWSSRYTPTGGWGPEVVFETDPPWAFDLAMDPQGNAMAVWFLITSIAPSEAGVWSNRFTPSGGWGVPELVQTVTGPRWEPQVGMDARGNAIAVWAQGSPINHIWSARFTPSGGWGVPERIESNDIYETTRPQIAVNPYGDAVAVWEFWGRTAVEFVYRPAIQSNQFR